MERILEQASAETNHSDHDCIFIAVLSHGELGILYASDHAYKPDRLWTHFNAEKCPTLAGNFFCKCCRIGYVLCISVINYQTLKNHLIHDL